MFAIEDEVGNGVKCAPELGGSVAVQAGLGARGIIIGEQARALERSRIPHQRGNLFRAHAVESLLFEHGPHHAVTRGAIAFERVDERQSDLAFLQIAQHRLAELQR
jgi:hypothetical protein